MIRCRVVALVLTALALAACSGSPAEISLTGKKACGLVPESAWGEFKISKTGLEQPNPTFGGSAECFYGTDVATYIVTLVTSEGMDAWTTAKREGTAKPADKIKDRAALTITYERNPLACKAAVEIAGGQYVLTSVQTIPFYESNLPPRCDAARKLAELVVSSLGG
jgi:hypothetical protein